MVSADFRITHASMARKVTSNMQRSLQKLEQLQEQISSNRQILRPSDSPVGTVAALRLRAELGRNEQIARNLDDATAWLASADGTLSAVNDQVTRARDLTIQAQNGALGQTERDAIATEIDAIRQGLIGLANTRYLDRSIFAGTVETAAYDANGNFVGQPATVERTIAPGVRVQVNLNGDELFGPPGADLFRVMSDLATAIRTDPTTIDTALSALDARTTVIQQHHAEVGARTNRILTMQDRNLSGASTLKQNLSQVEDVDLPQAIMEMRIRETAYHAALQTTAMVIQPSLVDFLR
jgi:flagellar hook-associated protein 3 FlgL